MIFWCLILIVFAFLSLAIDTGRLPYYIFRHLWNFLLIGLGIILFLRVKGKENQGFLEHLEYQISDLVSRIDQKRTDSVHKRMDNIDDRLRKMEKGI